jgi:hypothetical protein
MRLTSALLVLWAVGCAHPFTRIQPGMNSTEVRGTTGDVAPTNVIPWGPGTQSWYYGGNRCVLFIDDKVAAKFSPDDAPTGTTESVCLPPGNTTPLPSVTPPPPTNSPPPPTSTP